MEDNNGNGWKILFKLMLKKYKVMLIVAAIVIIIILSATKYIIDWSDATFSWWNEEVKPDNYQKNVGFDAENGKYVANLSAEELWKKNKEYRTNLSDVESLSYLLNAELVSQYPYIDGIDSDSLNGIIKFYRNNNDRAMKYVSNDVLEGYVTQYNGGDRNIINEALNCFTIDSNDGSIKIIYLKEGKQNTIYTTDRNAYQDAINKLDRENHSEVGGGYLVQNFESTVDTMNISYKNLVQKYVLQFELLWKFVVYGNEDGEKLAKTIASMAYDGVIDLIIDDSNVKTVTEKEYNYYIQTKSEYQNIRLNQESHNLYSYNPISLIYNDEYYVTYTQIIEKSSPIMKIKKIESWCATYENDAKYEEIEKSEEEKNSGSIDAEDWELFDEFEANPIKYDDLFDKNLLENARTNNGLSMGDSIDKIQEKYLEEQKNINNNKENKENKENDSNVKNETNKPNLEIYYTKVTNKRRNGDETENNVAIPVTTNKSTTKSSYGEGTVTAPSLNQDIIDIFRVSSFSPLISTYSKYGWTEEAIEDDLHTSNLLDLVRYILNKAKDDNYDSSEEEFKSVWNKIGSNFTSVGTGSLEGEDVNAIYNYFIGQGLTNAGAAGLMGNLNEESRMDPHVVQGHLGDKSYNDQYTDKVDSGEETVDSFSTDKVGYGLVQWTTPDRKENLYNYAKDKNKSIGDLEMQLEFIIKELKESYKSVDTILRTSNDLSTCVNIVLHSYENPTQQDTEVEQVRLSYAQEYYK